jgi:hypothetical protein
MSCKPTVDEVCLMGQPPGTSEAGIFAQQPE